MAMVNDQLFTPLLAYLSILNTLTVVRAAERRRQLRVRGTATVKEHGNARVRGPLHRRLSPRPARPRTSWPDQLPAAQRVRGRRARRAEPRDRRQRAAAQRHARARVGRRHRASKPGTTVDLKVLLRTYRGEEITKHGAGGDSGQRARQPSRSWWPTATRLSQWEARELQVQPLQTRGLPQMMRVLNSARKNNRLYVRLLTPRRRRRRQGRIARRAAAVGAGGHGVRSQRRQLPPAPERAAGRVGDPDRARGHRLAHADAPARGIDGPVASGNAMTCSGPRSRSA